jgi:hypothetical protein
MSFNINFILLCVLLMVATFIASLIPIFVGASPKIINIVSMFGAGMIVGVTLIVIIPEGIKAAYKTAFYRAAGTITYGDIGIPVILMLILERIIDSCNKDK